MTAPSIKQSSIIPDLPRDPQVVDPKTGELTASYKLFLDQLILALQTNFKPEGILFPQQPDSNISLLTNINSLANIVYDSTNNVFKGNVLTAPNTYTWKTFTMS
jgi:hypothetical protein